MSMYACVCSNTQSMRQTVCARALCTVAYIIKFWLTVNKIEIEVHAVLIGQRVKTLLFTAPCTTVVSEVDSIHTSLFFICN